MKSITKDEKGFRVSKTKVKTSAKGTKVKTITYSKPYKSGSELLQTKTKVVTKNGKTRNKLGLYR